MRRPSERGWDILARFVQERAKRQGPDGDLADEEAEEALQEAAGDARRLLQDKGYQRLRLQALEETVGDFAAWLALDPAHPNFERELVGLHLRAAPRYWEMFRAEAVIAEDAERRKRRNKEEETAHGLQRRRRV
jgi:hypothetical protein